MKKLGKKKIFKKEARFTKVLTKYSTEYNNMLFIQNLCKQLNMDKKDMLSYFLHLRQTLSDEDIIKLFNNENYDINKLDINRIYRFIDSHTIKNN
jgi:predicted solute-binding protein